MHNGLEPDWWLVGRWGDHVLQWHGEGVIKMLHFCLHVSNWKDAAVSFKNHESSIYHKEAVMVMVTPLELLHQI